MITKENTTIFKRGFTSFDLKIIAMVAMLIDHIAIKFCGDYELLYKLMRIIGRMSFPIFCFLLVEGFLHTRSRKNYALRLTLFAFLSEIPYDLFGGHFIYLPKQNVLFTLLIGFLVIWVLDDIDCFRKNDEQKSGFTIFREGYCVIMELLALCLGMIVSMKLECIYTYTGVLLIVLLYATRNQRYGQLVSNIAINLGIYKLSLQAAGILSTIPLSFYNGKPGQKKFKYLFYIFYPLHLVILAGIKWIL